jgi:hypothetical protein
MKYAIDPHSSWQPLEHAAARAASERQSAALLRVRDHLRAEIHGDLVAVMQTLAAEPQYHMWNQAAPIVLRGRATIEGLYQEMFDRGAEQLEFVIEKIVAGDHDIVTEGRLKQVHRASDLQVMGVHDVAGRAIEDESLWLSDAQVVVIWPMAEDGLLVGQDTYYGEDPLATLEPIDRQSLPPYFNVR